MERECHLVSWRNGFNGSIVDLKKKQYSVRLTLSSALSIFHSKATAIQGELLARLKDAACILFIGIPGAIGIWLGDLGLGLK